VSTRWFIVPGTLLALLFASAALAGQYQKTKDGKTLVWNEDHKPDELVSWSGKRDGDGYATGYGTLTWYTPDDMLETGSNLPRKHYRVSSRVAGTMVQGKFGEAPPTATSAAPVAPEKPKKKWGLFGIFKPRPKPTPAQVEATPTPRPKSRSTHVEATPQTSSPPPTNAEAAPPPAAIPTATSSAANNSLESLMHAPSSLRLNSPAASPSPTSPSPAAMPDVQLTQPSSPSPTPQ
jgi:hypothetical protein